MSRRCWCSSTGGGIDYDLTSDLDLELTRNPRASDRDGVLMLGAPRWVTRTLGRRLRRYVDDGGRLAVIGADSLRRGVRLRVHASEESGTLSRATQPGAADPFGARVARCARRRSRFRSANSRAARPTG